MTIPAAPTNVVAGSRDQALLISWNMATSATSYRVYWSATSGVNKTNGTRIDVAGTSTLLQGLTNGTAIYCVVTALNSAGESVESAQAVGVPRLPSSNDPPVLLSSRPEPDQRGVFHDSTVMARFDKDLDGTTVISANITFVSSTGTPVNFMVSAAGPQVVLTPVSPLAPQTRYDVTFGTNIRDLGGRQLAAPISFGFTTSSPPPANVRAVVGAGAFTFLWDAVPGATQYRVDRTTIATNTTASTPSTGLSYTFPSVTNGTPTSMRVAALTPWGITPVSAEVVVNTSASNAATPTTVRVMSAGATSALINWANNSSNDGWSIYRATQPGGPYTQLTTGWSRTTYLDTTIPPGNPNVFYVVQGEALGRVSAYSEEIGARLDSTVPAAPANFVATTGINWVKLTWNATPMANGYIVWGTAGNTAAPTQLAWVTSGTRFDHINLTNGVDYRYFVQAVVNGVAGDFATASSTPIVAPAHTYRPMILSVSSVALNRVSLSYSQPSGSTVQILRSTTRGGPYVAVGSNANDMTVAPSTTYFYVVRADNGSTQGELSNEVQVTTPSPMPSVPTGLTVTATDSAVNLMWTPVADASLYQIGTSTSPTGPFNGSATTIDSHAVQSSTNATSMYFAVRSGNGTDYSAWSSPIAATATSSGLTTPAVYAVSGNGVVTVNWTAVTGATAYRVWRKIPFVTDWSEVLPPTQTLGFNDTNVVNENNYIYQVQAQNTGAGTWSPFGTLTSAARPTATRSPRVTNFNVTPTAEGFLVSWAPVPGATGYTVRGGLRPGASLGGSSPVCGTADAYDTRCNLSGVLGTSYWVSMTATTPEGETAWTDELGPLQPNSLSPPTPGIFTYTGNSRVQSYAASQPMTQYRFARRFRGRDWQVLPQGVDPYFFEPQTNSVEVRYSLQAVRGANVSWWSITSNYVQPSFQSPLVPDTVTLTPVNAGAIVEWDPPILGVNSLSVQTTTDLYGTSATNAGTTSDPLDTIRTIPSIGVPRLVRIIPGSLSINSMPQLIVPNNTVPASPTQLTLQTGLQAVDLEWNAISGATAYRVYHRVGTQPWRLLVTVPSTVLSVRDHAVETGESVSWAFNAVTPNGVTGWSPLRTAVMNNLNPATPINVRLTPGDDAVTATWDFVPGATGYNVQVSNNGGMSWTGSCNFNGLPWDNHCRVSANNGSSPLVRVYSLVSGGSYVSLWSVPVGGATPSATLPDTVTLPSATANGTGSLSVSWTLSGDSTSYRVYRRTTNGPAAQVMDVTAPPFIDSGLQSGTQYVYYVHGINGAGQGAWSSGSTPVAAP